MAGPGDRSDPNDDADGNTGVLHLGGSTERAAARELLTRWLLPLHIGAIAGIGPLALVSLGLALAIAVVLWALEDRPRGVAFGGALVGPGGAWLVVWGRAVQWCAGLKHGDRWLCRTGSRWPALRPDPRTRGGRRHFLRQRQRPTRPRAVPPDDPASAGQAH